MGGSNRGKGRGRGEKGNGTERKGSERERERTGGTGPSRKFLDPPLIVGPRTRTQPLSGIRVGESEAAAEIITLNVYIVVMASLRQCVC